MNEAENQPNESAIVAAEWNLESAQSAYSAMAIFLEHIQISGLVIASLAHTIGEERLKEMVQSEPWKLYMASKRQLDEARKKVEALTELIERHSKSTTQNE